MLCAILYLENSDKARFADLKKCVKKDYVLNMAEYPRDATAVQSLILNYHPNYNSNRQPQSQCIINQLTSAQRGKTGDDEGETRRGQAQDVLFFYMRSHLSKLKSCKSIISNDFFHFHI